MADIEKIVTEDSAVKEAKKTTKKTTKPKAAKPEAPKVNIEKAPAKTKRVFNSNDLILCRSVCFGELFLEGKKTGMIYTWSNSGDVREVEYQDLLSWKVLRASPLFDPLIVIEDEDLREEWKDALGAMYDKMEDVDVIAMFDMDYERFVSMLKKLPDRVKDTVKNMANSMIRDGRLYDLRKIKALDEILDAELMMMIE